MTFVIYLPLSLWKAVPVPVSPRDNLSIFSPDYCLYDVNCCVENSYIGADENKSSMNQSNPFDCARIVDRAYLYR